MRIPSRILEHPIEAAIASLLLLGLLFGSSEIPGAKTPETAPTMAAQKL
ncbi:MAG TPA: hypothetical protein VN723_11745 [Rhizomicrobium sp.]|jgi:hypothetical protein|nr:hypothetical protein [Rhizomicrobium sp.]